MELMDHEQFQVNGSIERSEVAGFGEVRQATPAARFSVSPSEIAGPAQRLGEHSVEILTELGYEEGKRDALLAAGAVVQWSETDRA